MQAVSQASDDYGFENAPAANTVNTQIPNTSYKPHPDVPLNPTDKRRIFYRSWTYSNAC